MGIPRDMRDSADLEEGQEMLPLYQENYEADPSFDGRLPDPNAGPSEVRHFLWQVMQARGNPAAQASRLADRWSLGTGRELRSYPVTMYCQIFGADEDSWAVYMAVKSQQYKEEEQDPKKWSPYLVMGLFLAAALISTVLGVVIFKNDGNGFSRVFVPLVLMTIGGPSSLGLILALCIHKPVDPEKKAEFELNEYWKQKGKGKATE